MTAERFARVKELFALALPVPEGERAAVLARECGEDVELAREVMELIAHAQAAPRFLTGRASAGPEPTELAPHAIGIPGFTLERILGRGGMGVVYLARQHSPAREVAIKCLRFDSMTPRELERFRREAEILARLSHPGIAQVHGAGTAITDHGEQPWIAMEYVPGVPLLEHAGTLALRARIELLAELCRALEHAHAKGIVHRDLKPSNVLVDEQKRARVLDFGVARLIGDSRETALRTRTGQLVGTLAYMSPEQARGGGDEIDSRSDVYALGVIGFELLTGRLPYAIDEDDLLGTIRTICEESPDALRRWRPDAPADLETIVGKALSKEPELRYASAGQLEADLQRLLAERPIQARRPTTFYQARKFARRNRALTFATAAVIAALAIGLGLSLATLRVARNHSAFTSEVLDHLAANMVDLTPRLGFGEENRADLEEAVALIERQLENDATPGLRGARARLLYELVELDQARHDTATMRRHLELALAAREGLAAEDPADLESRTHLSQIYAKLGELARDEGNLEERDRWFARALEHDESLVRAHPGDMELLEDLGWSLERVAMVAAESGDVERSDPMHARRLELAQELVRHDPDHWKYIYNLAKAHSFAGSIVARRGHPELALDHARENIRLSRRLCELQPGRRDFLIWLVHACRAGHHLLAKQGDWNAAQELAIEAARRAEAAWSGEPDRAELVELLCGSIAELFRVYRAMERSPEADAVVKHLRQLVTSRAPSDPLPHAQSLLETAARLERESSALAGTEAPAPPVR